MKKKKPELSQAERDAFAMVGRVGGKANFKKNGRKHMQKIGRQAAAVRWANKHNEVKE
jgi:hypothetical protein